MKSKPPINILFFKLIARDHFIPAFFILLDLCYHIVCG